MDIKIFFFLGKGGVGKTTLASLSALYLAQKRLTEIYSLDQAHNLGDFFGHNLQNKTLITSNLYAQEVDLQQWKKEYLRRIKQNLKSSYSYLTAYNLIDIFDIFEYAPDIEELAMILAFENIISSAKDRVIIFDMPPTALALEFFLIVDRNLLWLSKLIELRKKIQNKHQIITQIRMGKKVHYTDKILNKLVELQDFYKKVKNILHSSYLLIVYNPDQMSKLEADRISQRLKQLNYNQIFYILNKTDQCEKLPCFKLFKEKKHFTDLSNIQADNKKFFLWLEKFVKD